MDDLPYRSSAPAHVLPTTQQPSSVDEGEFSTLKVVRDTLAEGVEGLYKDFNAFDLLKTGKKTEAAYDLIVQIESKKIAYDILAPLLETVVSTMESINAKYRQR